MPLQKRFCGQKINGQAVETRIDVPFPSKIGGTCFEYSKVETKKVQITWDPKKVQVLGISLAGSCRGDFPWPASFYIELLLYVNDNLVVARQLRTTGEVATWDASIGQYIINGWNTFKAEIKKPGCNAYVAGLDVYVSFFSNVIPEHKTEEEQMWSYIKWGAIGLSILGAVYVGIRVYEARKKKS